MGNAFLYGSSGGTSLNFKVIQYAAEEALLAAVPAENAIGAITETKITSWLFSPSEPAAPAEGMLWIAVGTAGTVELNALKKNGVILYPKYARQYISGQWVRVNAWIYQGGAWNSFFSGLLYDGSYYVPHTDYRTPDTASIVEGEGFITLATVAKKASEVYKVFGPVPLDGIDAITMTSSFVSSVGGSHMRVLYVAQNADVGYEDAVAIEAVDDKSSWTEEMPITLDVSDLSGDYYVYAGTNTNGSAWEYAREIRITKVTGEDSDVMAAKAAAYDILTEGVGSE